MKVDVKTLVDAGVHFGHEKRKWDPKMAPYILGEKNGVYIIDIRQTAQCLERACEFLSKLAASGKGVLFVGTKKQAQRAVLDAARKSGMHYIRQRWLGGTLTNFATVKKSIQRLREMEAMQENGQVDALSKKVQSNFNREHKRLEKSLGGLKALTELPGALVVIDTQREKIAVAEANRLGIPVVGIVDTKCDPDPIDYVVPANDDAIKAARVLFGLISDAVWEGRQRYLKERGLPIEEAPSEDDGVDEVGDDEVGETTVSDDDRDESGVVVKSAPESGGNETRPKDSANGGQKAEEWE